MGKNEFTIKTYNKSSIADEFPDYKDALTEISNHAGFNPNGSFLDRWIELSDIISIVFVEGKPVGFSTAGKILPDKNLIYIAATMVSEKYQNRGFSSKLWLDSFKKALSKDIRCWLKPVYFIFRTQNPKLYSILNKKIAIYPNLNNKQLNKEEKEMVIQAADIIWPNQELNVSEMIMPDAFKNTPWFLPDVDQINWSGNNQVDAFFERKLQLKEHGLDIFLILGKIRLGLFMFFVK